MSDITVGILSLIVLIGIFFTGFELAFSMAVVGFLGFAHVVSFSAATNLLAKDLLDTFTSYGLTVIPLFVLMGQIAYYSGVANKLYSAAYKFVGHVPGGLAMATVVGATLFKAMCGSTLATCATFASVAIPEMERYGYNKKLSNGIVASVGTLGILIPPSITLIIFGIITQQSIGKLFLAGVLPGLLISFLFAVVIFGWVRIDPTIAPGGERSSWKERAVALPEFLTVAIVFGVIIGGLMKGFFSPTEAGTIGTVSVFIVAIFKGKVTLDGMVKSFDESLRMACMVLMLVGGSAVLGHFLAVTEIPMIAADWITGLPINRYIIMFFIVLVYLVGGSFIDDIAFMILATPIFYPAVLKLGFDPIWFGIMIGITVMVGVVIPPVAICVFIVKGITGEPFSVIYAGVYPFLLALVAAAILLFLFPQIATFLPTALMGA
jgi:tripartite ATP-independent transporter DctM subunit